MDEKKMKMMAVAGEILAYKPMKQIEIDEWAMPKVIEPIIVSPSGQERRRQRRKQARKK